MVTCEFKVGLSLLRDFRPTVWQRLCLWIVQTAVRSVTTVKRPTIDLNADINPYPIVFIVGCPRSGTSWTRNIFNQRSDVVSTTESQFYPFVYAPLKHHGLWSLRGWGAVLGGDLYRRVRKEYVGIHYFIRLADLYALLDQIFTQMKSDPNCSVETVTGKIVQRIYFNYFQAHGGVNGKVFVEKTPQHLRYAKLMLQHFPNSKMIEVIRDGRDVCVSLQMRSAHVRDFPKNRAGQIALWKEFIELGLALRSQPNLTGQIHHIRYEQLQENRIDQIATLFRFAGLQFDDALVEKIAQRTDIETVPDRHRGPALHVRKGVVGDWHNHFTIDDIALFKQMVSTLR